MVSDNLDDELQGFVNNEALLLHIVEAFEIDIRQLHARQFYRVSASDSKAEALGRSSDETSYCGNRCIEGRFACEGPQDIWVLFVVAVGVDPVVKFDCAYK